MLCAGADLMFLFLLCVVFNDTMFSCGGPETISSGGGVDTMLIG